MHSRELLAIQRERPFVPVRVHVSDGATYEVRHPEMMLVTASLVFIALGGENGDVPESWVRCDPLHITRIDPIQVTGQSGGRQTP
jgi:hypothetical protein